ncbi:MAG: N-acetylmuramoyl-L-alanine amidase [Desulfobulbus sp.]|uniref:N-acetylmuramoyl-L-alanine amidase n=1 Tax=Desulfobulbus sp. TaxID=895 RepID=UPI00284B66A5|nr:N-acetylmuramoyl-L-alanine amidase [Desulfobulbus sp.]MDR2550631.1 N-acetylmuramoyl-L-alanine amidase [Desulfobulbus sp.]
MTLFALLSFARLKGVERLLAVAFLMLVVATAPAVAAPKTAGKAMSKAGIKVEATEKLTAEQQYKAAKDFAERLEHDKTLGKSHSNWLNCAQAFRKIYVSERKGDLGPNSLFMAGKTYRRAYDLFKISQDLDNALKSFLELADVYPGHALADDALNEAAECARMTPGNEGTANDLYRKIAALYPQGDQIEKIKGKERPQKSRATSKQSAQVSAPPSQPRLATLSPVKYWSSDDYCRIVLESDAPVPFSAKVLPKGDGQDQRLAIELGQSFIDQKNRQPVQVRTGLLKGIRPDLLSGDTTRVVLDLSSFSGYKIFSLPDPFRVIVDIRGGNTRAAGPATPPTAIPQIAQPPGDAATARNSASDSVRPIISLKEQKKHSPQSVVMPPVSSPSKGKSREKLSLAQQLGLGIRKIVIDPGHGGKDPGAMAFGLKEKDIVLTVSKKVAKVLNETYRYEVVLTRTKDVFIPLEERTAIANTQKSDLFISIHTNAHSDRGKSGIETYFLNLATDANAMRVAALENATSTHSISEMQDILSTMMKNSKLDESTRLAQFVQSNLISGLGRSYKLRNLGVKQAPFYVLIGAEMPAILTEISFITNPDEAKLLQNDQYLDQIAAHIAAGIAAYVDHHHTAAVTL